MRPRPRAWRNSRPEHGDSDYCRCSVAIAGRLGTRLALCFAMTVSTAAARQGLESLFISRPTGTAQKLKGHVAWYRHAKADYSVMPGTFPYYGQVTHFEGKRSDIGKGECRQNSRKRAKSFLPRQGSNLRPPSTAKHLNCLTARCNYHCATKNRIFCGFCDIIYQTVRERQAEPQSKQAVSRAHGCHVIRVQLFDKSLGALVASGAAYTAYMNKSTQNENDIVDSDRGGSRVASSQ